MINLEIGGKSYFNPREVINQEVAKGDKEKSSKTSSRPKLQSIIVDNRKHRKIEKKTKRRKNRDRKEHISHE